MNLPLGENFTKELKKQKSKRPNTPILDIEKYSSERSLSFCVFLSLHWWVVVIDQSLQALSCCGVPDASIFHLGIRRKEKENKNSEMT